MSLVGTRPILQDELQKYELHHRARIAIKPGITGMWQVSGRSDMECLHVQVGSFEKANFAGAMLRKNKWEKVNFAEADFNHATVSKSDIRQLESAGAVLLNINNKKSERC